MAVLDDVMRMAARLYDVEPVAAGDDLIRKDGKRVQVKAVGEGEPADRAIRPCDVLLVVRMDATHAPVGAIEVDYSRSSSDAPGWTLGFASDSNVRVISAGELVA